MAPACRGTGRWRGNHGITYGSRTPYPGARRGRVGR